MAKNAKQLKVPGTEPKALKEVNDAAEQYVEARDERMGLTEKEVEAKDALISVMQKHSLTVYRDDDADPPLVVTIIPGVDKVKVSRVTDDDAGVED